MPTFTSTSASGPAPSWDLANYQDVQDILTSANLKIIDDPANEGVENLPLVQRCGDYADSWIYARLAPFGFKTPLSGMDAGSAAIMANISATLVIWQLDQARALVSSEENAKTVIAQWWDEADGQLSSIGLGTLRIVADRIADANTAAVPITGRLSDNTLSAFALDNPRGWGPGYGGW